MASSLTLFSDAYGHTKALAEDYVLKANGKANGKKGGLLTVAIRPHSIYGPGDVHSWPEMIKLAKVGSILLFTYLSYDSFPSFSFRYLGG